MRSEQPGNGHSAAANGHASGESRGARKPVPRLVAWEITRQCHLDCRHCRAAASNGPYEDELTVSEIRRVMDNIDTLSKPIVILTGGDPLRRDDVFDIVRYGADRGFRMVMSPCGKRLTETTANRLLEAGIQRISISLDGATARSHDAFRRVSGAFTEALRGLEAARSAGLPYQINTTVTRANVAELPELLDLAVRSGAVAFSPFLLVPTGRGKELAEQAIPAETYEQVLNWIYEVRDRVPIQVRPTCAPHFYRILRTREREAGRAVTPESHGLDAMTRGCLGGHGFAFISHVGKVQICGFLEKECGDLREESYDFVRIWEDSPVFKAVRDRSGCSGRCAACEYWSVCGGCRARAYAATGDYLGEEPCCTYVPAAIRKGTSRG